ncbi:hypothetical protein EDF60_1661 [Leucobacter luti]|uniref:hypothetical protein n=1 Tax=Leucobacter luti TaxID=340320 RepID=UPI001048E3F4|nr:hypothetical protein [Leucobacter luti]MCW2287010.1 hypothetical protein [Leucobacter luti]TCK41235.1 hypothetical protein EDF60_1661 [Leucobacter luti]
MVAWFRVDDQFGTNPKVMQIPRAERHACLGLWLQAGVWSAQHLTDGRIPGYMLEELGAEVSHRDRLVTVGLWQEDGDDIVFNDWADYQPSRADVMANREKERRRKEAYRLKKAGITGQSPDGTQTDEDTGRQRVSGHPDPTRPDPARPTKEVANATSTRKARGARITSDWMPDSGLIQQMQSECPGLDLESEHKVFVDYWIAQPGQKGVKLDWAATWRNWMRRKFGERGGGAVGARGQSGPKPTAGDRARAIADEFRKEGL